MKTIVKMMKAGAYAEAKKAAKTGIVKDFNAEMNLLRMISSCQLNSEEVFIIRVAHRNNGCFNDLSQLVSEIEHAVIETENWAKIQTLIEDASLEVGNLAFLIYTIYNSKEDQNAREVFFKADELYDLNNIEWPEKLVDFCQQMSAEIAIYHSTH